MARYPYSDRYTVEDCRTLEVGFLKDHGYLDGLKVGIVGWTFSGQEKAKIGIIVNPGHKPDITFKYTVGTGEDKEPMEYTSSLTTTTCNFGGKRYWFECGLHLMDLA
jgi:hypothetical protein